ncbi:glycosyltransferase family 2 protein [Microvirga flavescens]|uniref:glycosyltransferase family 2 protein n=1 Tax=Microvirga flavescens TaxID=2249811 RepID=UPI000DD5D175|nr:glycosyltransferase family 2 protein [Microvirga flavescens]
MPVKVSVILPTFNRSHSIVAACTSVLTQSFRDLELIVVDDGSREDVETPVRAIGDNRVRYVRRPVNGGAAAARNTGLAEAKGEFIAFQDSDDLWLPNKLQMQLDLFARLPAHVGVVTGAKIIYGRDDHFNYGPGRIAYAPPAHGRLKLDEDQLGHLLSENRVSLQNALFRRDCFPSFTWFDSKARANEDWEFAIRLAQHTTIFEDAEPVVLAFISPDSISSNFRKEGIGIVRVLKKNRRILERYRRQHAALLMDVSRSLYRARRKRAGRRFLLASIARYPGAVTWVAQSLLRKSYARIFRRARR